MQIKIHFGLHNELKMCLIQLFYETVYNKNLVNDVLPKRIKQINATTNTARMTVVKLS